MRQINFRVEELDIKVILVIVASFAGLLAAVAIIQCISTIRSRNPTSAVDTANIVASFGVYICLGLIVSIICLASAFRKRELPTQTSSRCPSSPPTILDGDQPKEKSIPQPTLDVGWQKVKLGLKVIAIDLILPPSLIVLSFCCWNLDMSFWLFGNLAGMGITFLVGMILNLAIPDPLARGFLVGSFLSLVLGTSGMFLVIQFPFRISPLVDAGVNVFILLLYQASICFFLLFLLRIARFFADRHLAGRCWGFLLIETLLVLVPWGGFWVNKTNRVYYEDSWPILILLGMLVSYCLFFYLLIYARETIDLGQTRTNIRHPR